MAQLLPSLQETLPQRRLEVHAQRLRSLAENHPELVADVISKWLRQDGGSWDRRLDRPAFLFPK
ncbi:MAG: hypothetical protein JO247_04940 [Chloroflexi bacterium]|nr:hypothetical protein [Chloroflexota bacterium]